MNGLEAAETSSAGTFRVTGTLCAVRVIFIDGGKLAAFRETQSAQTTVGRFDCNEIPNGAQKAIRPVGSLEKLENDSFLSSESHSTRWNAGKVEKRLIFELGKPFDLLDRWKSRKTTHLCARK